MSRWHRARAPKRKAPELTARWNPVESVMMAQAKRLEAAITAFAGTDLEGLKVVTFRYPPPTEEQIGQVFAGRRFAILDESRVLLWPEVSE